MEVWRVEDVGQCIYELESHDLGQKELEDENESLVHNQEHAVVADEVGEATVHGNNEEQPTSDVRQSLPRSSLA